MTKRVATLLTVFNRKEKTLKCLQNLYAQLPIEGYEVDVYLTNDGCTDGTPEAVAEQFPEVNIIQGNGTLFWNRGMYTAWEEAAKGDYDFYLWLNDDTFIYNNALHTLLGDAKSTYSEAIICGATCSAESGIITYGGRNEKGLVTPNGTLQQCRFFNGNVVLVPQSVYNIIGNLDYTFRHGFGDFDYGIRAEKKGIKSFQSSRFIGECEAHDSLPKWCNPTVPFKDRLKVFRTPLGGNPMEQFYSEKRRCGIFIASFHYFTVHLRLFFPHIWSIKNK